MLAFASHQSPFSHCAELTAGIAIVTAAIDAEATITTDTASRINILIAGPPPSGVYIIEPSPGREVKAETSTAAARLA
jgi:hypothetical protein